MATATLGQAIKAGFSAFAGALGRNAALSRFLRDGDTVSGDGGTVVNAPYSESTYVFAAINAISTPTKQARLEFRDAENGGEAVEDGDLSTFWKSPALGYHGPIRRSELIDLFVALRGTDGAFVALLDDSWLAFSSPLLKRPLRIVRESQLMPMIEAGSVVGYGVRMTNGEVAHFAPEQVIISRRANPHDLKALSGISPVEASKSHVESEVAGAAFAKRQMDRNGDQGSYIIAKGPTPAPEQQEWLLAQVREKRKAAAKNVVKDVVLGGDISIESPSLQGVGSEFASQQDRDARAIFNAFGLPPSMIEASASYSIGSASDLFRALHNVILPEAAELAALISQVSEYYLGYRSLAREVAEGFAVKPEREIFARFNFDDHPVMIERRSEQLARGKDLFQSGWSWEKINEYLDLGIQEFPGWDRQYLPGNLYPVEVAASADVAPGEKTPARSTADLADETRKLIGQLSDESRKAEEEKKRAAEKTARRERWARHDRARAATRKRIKTGFSKQVMKIRTQVLRNIEKELDSDGNFKMRTLDGVERRGVVLDLLFDLNSFKSAIIALVRGVGLDAFLKSGLEAWAEIGFEPPEDDPTFVAENPEVTKFLRQRENYMRGVSDDIHGKILDELEEGLNAGETMAELTARVRTAFTSIDKARAETIAVTETGAAYETARIVAFERAGVKFKSWLSSDDEKVRDSHLAADAKYNSAPIPLNEPFEVGAAQLQYPVDPYGGADHPEETINCRCVLEARLDADHTEAPPTLANQ